MPFLISTPSSRLLYDTMTVCWRSDFQIPTANIPLVAIISPHRDKRRQCIHQFRPMSRLELVQLRASILATANKKLTAGHNLLMPPMVPLHNSTNNTIGGLLWPARGFLPTNSVASHSTNTHPNRQRNRSLHKSNAL
jgi:hypothetical protein